MIQFIDEYFKVIVIWALVFCLLLFIIFEIVKVLLMGRINEKLYYLERNSTTISNKVSGLYDAELTIKNTLYDIERDVRDNNYYTKKIYKQKTKRGQINESN